MHWLNIAAIALGYMDLLVVAVAVVVCVAWYEWERRSQNLVLRGIQPRIEVRVRETV